MMRWIYLAVIRPCITYASLVWWHKTKIKKIHDTLEKLQRTVCLAITGALRTTPTAAMNTMLNLQPLSVAVQESALSTYARMKTSGNWLPVGTKDHNKIETILGPDSFTLMRTDSIDKELYFKKNYEVLIPERSTWQKSTEKLRRQTKTYYTDGSKMDGNTGAGIHGCGLDQSLSLGVHATVFQAEVFAILACARELVQSNEINRKISIFTDSQAALKAFDKPQISSKLVRECVQELSYLGTRNKLRLVWVPGHSGISGNERADELARQGSNTAYIGPEPVLCTPLCLIKAEIKSWRENEQRKYWSQSSGLRYSKLTTPEISKEKSKDLMALSRNSLRHAIGLLTGHCHLNGHLAKIGVIENNLCRLCNEEIETAQHIICECEAIGRKRFQILGTAMVHTANIRQIKVGDMLKIVKGTELLPGL